MDARLLERMGDALAHRGPDGEGFHTEAGLGLAFRRLAIIDIGCGNQPMFNEDGSVVIVFNGEIYNFQALREELVGLGHVFASDHSDTETVIHAWESWGIDCLQRLSGMYAFALWDRRRGQLLLVRDRLGEKPLYYGRAPDRSFVFGSELAALAPIPGLLGRLDARAIEDFFAYGYVPDPRSIYAGVQKLAAGHYLLIEDGKPPGEPTAYWRAAPSGELAGEGAVQELGCRLARAVDSRMISDVPLGAFLSGGIDSSAVVALAAAAHASPLDTFTMGFPGAEDERGPAELVSRRYGTLHHTATAEPSDIIAAASRQGAIFGEPFGDLSSVPTLAIAGLARRHVTVALSGDGGDEVFGGYRRYHWHLIGEAIRRQIPAPLRRSVIRPLARAYPRLDFAPRWLRAKTTLTELGLDSALGYYRMVTKVRDERRRALFSPGLRTELDGYDPAARIVSLMEEVGEDPLRQAQQVDLATYLPGDILVKVDRTSMAQSLEVRAPFLDHDLVAWGLALPPALKRRGAAGKLVLKQAMSARLPSAILERGKQGFSVSLARALRDAKPRLTASLLGSPMRECGFFAPAAIERLIAEHASGRIDHSQPLWLLLVFAGFLSSRVH